MICQEVRSKVNTISALQSAKTRNNVNHDREERRAGRSPRPALHRHSRTDLAPVRAYMFRPAPGRVPHGALFYLVRAKERLADASTLISSVITTKLPILPQIQALVHAPFPAFHPDSSHHRHSLDMEIPAPTPSGNVLALVVLDAKDAKARENLIGSGGSRLLCRRGEFEIGGS